jgi:hypothetical protein
MTCYITHVSLIYPSVINYESKGGVMKFFFSKKKFRQLIYFVCIMLCILTAPPNGIAAPFYTFLYANGTEAHGSLYGSVSGFRTQYIVGSFPEQDWSTFAHAYADSIYSYGVSIQTNPVPRVPVDGLAYAYIGEDYYIHIPNAAPDQISHFKGSFHLTGTFNAYDPMGTWQDNAYSVVWSVEVGAYGPDSVGMHLDPPSGIACKYFWCDSQYPYYGYDNFADSYIFTPKDGSVFNEFVNFDIEIVGSEAIVPIVEELTIYNWGIGSSANFYDPAEFSIDYSSLPLGTTITTGSGNLPTPTSSVPEPSTIMLLGFGLAGTGLIRKSYRK